MTLLCDFTDDGVCPRCGSTGEPGKTTRACQTPDEVTRALVEAAAPPWVRIPNPKLGDAVAATLAAVGITKERVSRIVGGDCGCDGRQEALNAASGKVAEFVEIVIDLTADAVLGKRS